MPNNVTKGEKILFEMSSIKAHILKLFNIYI